MSLLFFWQLCHLPLTHLPNYQCALNILPTELQCKKKLLISTDWAYRLPNVQKHACNVCVCYMYSNWAFILHTTVGGWVFTTQLFPHQEEARHFSFFFSFLPAHLTLSNFILLRGGRREQGEQEMKSGKARDMKLFFSAHSLFSLFLPAFSLPPSPFPWALSPMGERPSDTKKERKKSCN